jgi:hypothetical protein
MSSEGYSIIVRCRYDLPSGTTRLEAVRVDTGEVIHLKEGDFLLRVSMSRGAFLRCSIRHLGSGEEVFVQGGRKLQTFIRNTLLNGSTQRLPPSEPDTTAPL